YRTGPEPQLAVHDRAVPFDELVAALRESIDALLADTGAHALARLELTSARAQLAAVALGGATHEDVRVPEPVTVVVEPDRDAPLSFGAEFALREGALHDPVTSGDATCELVGDPPDDGPRQTARAFGESIERADLHALLFRGRVRMEIRGRTVDLGECHPMIVAERLIDLARRSFEAWEKGLPFSDRAEAAGVTLGVRVSVAGDLALTLAPSPFGGPERGSGRSSRRTPSGGRALHTFPALGVCDVLEAALAFGRALVRALLRRDRAQSSNLRLGALRRSLRDTTEALRAASQTDSKINPTPEPYRAFAAALDHEKAPSTPAIGAARLRYAARWRAIVPGVDLRSTYLCGDRLVVGAASEMWALDRATGGVIWRADVARGASVVTPGGIARLATDGSIALHDFVTGEVTLRASIAPRTGGAVAGAVVHLPGLPKLLVVTEGEHHLVAIDLASGEARWRWSWGNGPRSSRGTPRIKRAGRLVYFTCGDGALTSLDVLTGAVVWRLRDRLRFRSPPTVAHDALFVVAGGAHGVARLYCVDPYSGHVRWSRTLAAANAACTVEGMPLAAQGAVAVVLRQRTGLTLAAFRREDGATLGTHARAVAPSGTSWLAVDDAFIGNAPTGELVAIDASTGELRWRQILGRRPLESDVPRRLEPVLRCGALFVPHTDVVVVRPRDGTLLGAITNADAIPDLLRVDERCDVFLAEESGHVVAFGALPRLALVKKM
ncbi:MAG: PQQ-like beta-propeller repeat protein, partial [Myxococcota bacterium]|nr:PQQ-like beta-propeller repeat protein [Myxococcota bacterium]